MRVRARIVQTREIRNTNLYGSWRSRTWLHTVELPARRPGQRRQVQLSEAWGGSAHDRLAAGGTLPVLYDPAKPGVVRIDAPWALYFIPALFCVPALLLLALVGWAWLVT